MKAIILAAGIGKRLQKISEGLPKSIMKIGQSSIIHHQIESCLRVGIINFVIVLGYKKNKDGIYILSEPEEPWLHGGES